MAARRLGIDRPGVNVWLGERWFTVVLTEPRPLATLGGVAGAALAIGAVAGLYPALRAARLPPTEALRSV